VDQPHQPVVESTSSLAVTLPLTLGVILVLGYALNAVLRDKGLGIFGNGVFMFIGLWTGAFFMSLCQTYL
jgi:hypothetical protein